MKAHNASRIRFQPVGGGSTRRVDAVLYQYEGLAGGSAAAVVPLQGMLLRVHEVVMSHGTTPDKAEQRVWQLRNDERVIGEFPDYLDAVTALRAIAAKAGAGSRWWRWMRNSLVAVTTVGVLLTLYGMSLRDATLSYADSTRAGVSTLSPVQSPSLAARPAPARDHSGLAWLDNP